MRYSSIGILLYAASVLGVPTESSLNLPDMPDQVLDQGDGFYQATLNETGALNVEFTPMAELVARETVDQLAARDMHTLTKREEIHCLKRQTIALGTLDEANRQLARNANAQGHYGKNKWGWVHSGAETSFFCSYKDNFLTYDLVIDMHTTVSRRCGQSFYGHERRRNSGGANDLTVGRTFRGDHFCDGKTHS